MAPLSHVHGGRQPGTGRVESKVTLHDSAKDYLKTSTRNLLIIRLLGYGSNGMRPTRQISLSRFRVGQVNVQCAPAASAICSSF